MNPVDTIDHIDHSAIVVSTDPAKNIVRVKIDECDDRDNCPVSELCEAGDGSSNIVSIMTPHASAYKKGDAVTVRGTEQMDKKAVMCATVLPCIALVAVMVLVFTLTFNQLAAVLSGVGVTILFFIILWASRNRIKHQFLFTIIDKK